MELQPKLQAAAGFEGGPDVDDGLGVAREWIYTVPTRAVQDNVIRLKPATFIRALKRVRVGRRREHECEQDGRECPKR